MRLHPHGKVSRRIRSPAQPQNEGALTRLPRTGPDPDRCRYRPASRSVPGHLLIVPPRGRLVGYRGRVLSLTLHLSEPDLGPIASAGESSAGAPGGATPATT